MLIAGRAALALQQWRPAQSYAEQALALAEARGLPDIAFPVRHLAGQLAVQAGELTAGLAAFEQAIQEIESLCGQMMVEFRASFVEDKERIYEDAVDLSLRLDQSAARPGASRTGQITRTAGFAGPPPGFKHLRAQPGRPAHRGRASGSACCSVTACTAACISGECALSEHGSSGDW